MTFARDGFSFEKQIFDFERQILVKRKQDRERLPMRQTGRFLAFLLVACGLAGSGALADDLPAKAAPSTAPMNWTGFHVGGHVGWGWIDQSATLKKVTGAAAVLDSNGKTYGLDHSGVLGGAQLGYDYQIQHWVLGIGGDFSWSGANGESKTEGALIAGSTVDLKSKADWYATVTGRVGYTWDDLLLYGKGGLALTHDVYGGFSTASGVKDRVSDVSATRVGWTVGAGLEWAFAPHWSLFGEYDYLAFGTKNYTFKGSAGAKSSFDIKSNVNQVKLGVNYRF
jgi:outer membrane immunogenic protein